MFKVTQYNDDVTRSIYKIDGQKKTVTYPELVAHIASAGGGNIALMTDADKKPIFDQIATANKAAKPNEQQQAFGDVITILEENLPLHQQCLNAEMVDGFKKYIAWTTDDKGVVAFLARTESKGNTWTVVDNIIQYITANKINGIYIQEELSKEYFKTRRAGKNGPMMYQIIDEETGAWSAPTTKARLYWQAYERIAKNDEVNIDRDLAIKAIQWMSTHEANLAPFIEIFTSGTGGWLYALWLKSSLATIDMPTTMSNDATVPAFSYIDLTLEKQGASDDFDGWLESLPEICREPFCAILYCSLTEKVERIPLVTWLHGEGNDGKSAIMGSFGEMFGKSLVGAISASVATSEFGGEILLGKRLIMLGDAQTGNILNTNLMHALTGGDPYVINRKNEKHINYTFNSIVMIGANTPPNVNMYHRNQARRIFYVPMQEPSEATMRKYCLSDANGKIKRYVTGMPMYNGYNLKAGLVKEMPAIMYKCRLAFEKYSNGTHNTIVLPEECFNLAMNRCGSDEMDVIQSFFDSCVTVNKNASTSVLDLNREYLKFAHGEHNSNDLSKYSFELSNVKRHIKTAYNVEATQPTMDGKRQRMYVGIKMRSQIEGFAKSASTEIKEVNNDFNFF